MIGRVGNFIPLLLLCLTTACGTSTKSESPQSAEGVEKTVTEGPVTLTVRTPRVELAFTESTEIVVEVTAEKGVTVDLADYDAGVDAERRYEFRLTRLGRESGIPMDSARFRWTDRYRLEFFLPGDYEMPAAKATFVDVREAAESPAGTQTERAPEPRELSTEVFRITARESPDKAMSAEELRSVETPPPVDLREPFSGWWWAIPAAAAILLTAALLIRRRRGRAEFHPPPIPAHEWAQRELAALIAEELIGKGRIQEFYYRISDIVRGYIERRFDISAPEMTTEEFLNTATSDARFERRNTIELNGFLAACDLVKYARHAPQRAEADELIRTAGSFVERTRLRLVRLEGEPQPVAVSESSS